jgi:hypothetical protein
MGGNLDCANFIIRRIGSLCAGVSYDSAPNIHLKAAPLHYTRLLKREFDDLTQIEVLRLAQCMATTW